MGNIVDYFGFYFRSHLYRFSVNFHYLEYCHLRAMSDTFSFYRFCFKLKDRIPLSVLLLVSINVELHPSSSVEHPCNICILEVENSGKVVFVTNGFMLLAAQVLKNQLMMIW